MAVSREEFKKWVRDGKRNGYSHMISVCDTFNHEDYPIYISTLKELRSRKKLIENEDMQRINEIVVL